MAAFAAVVVDVVFTGAGELAGLGPVPGLPGVWIAIVMLAVIT